MKTTLRVCIDARLEPGKAGGVVQGVLGLVHGLSRLDDGPEDYRLLVRPGGGEWLRPYLNERLSVLEAVRPEAPMPLPPLRSRIVPGLRRRIGARTDEAGELVPPSKGVAEHWGAEVVHLPTQQGFRTAIPTIYHPWDLQHVHYPDFFEPDDLRERDLIYRALCRQARVVVTPTRWGAEDVIANLDVPRRKVAVIHPASPLTAYPEPTAADVARVRAEFALPDAFMVYPAQTWPHKNHLALVEALAVLAAEGVRPTVVCPGWRNDFHATIESRARAADVAEQLPFPGHVHGPDMAALYRLARAFVFPSLFEGWGFPVLEAFSAEVPVACSDIPPLREVVGTAALTFDGTRPDDLARQLRRIWEDAGLRRDLVERGRKRARHFSWERTARVSRAHYRRLAGTRLNHDDAELVRESAA